MGSKALNDLFKYMDSIAEQEGAAKTQLAKLNHRKQAAPLVLRDLREVQTQELMARLGKQRDINAKLREQQAEVGRAPEPDMPVVQPRTSQVGAEIGSSVANAAAQSIAGMGAPTENADSASVPGGTPGPAGAQLTQRQVVTTRGTESNVPRIGSPAGQLLLHSLYALAGKSTRPTEEQRTVDIYEPTELTPLQKAQLEIQRRTGAAQIANSLDNYAASDIPRMIGVVDKMTRGQPITPEDMAGIKSLNEKQLEASQGNYANLASYRQQRLEQEQAKADAKVGAEDAKRRAADLTALSVGEDIQRKSRERAVAEGRFDGTNMARAMFPDLSPAAFAGDTLDALHADIRGSAKESGAFGIGGRSIADLQDADINTLAMRAANMNQVLVKVGKGEDAKLDLLPGGYKRWIVLDQVARGVDPRRSPEEVKKAQQELANYGLIEMKGGKPEPVSKGNFASTSRILWELGDPGGEDRPPGPLFNTPAWREAMGGEFSGPGRQAGPGVGKTPAQLEEEKRRLEFQQQQIRALSGALFLTPEGQLSIGQ